MKKLTLTIAALSLLTTYSCKKSGEGNKNVIMKENVEESIHNENGETDTAFAAEKTMKNGDKESTESTYRYVAEDGSSALVTFKNDQEGNTITIKSNNATLYAKQEKSDGKTTIYKNQNVEIKSEGDHVTITQENHVIELKKARGQ